MILQLDRKIYYAFIILLFYSAVVSGLFVSAHYSKENVELSYDQLFNAFLDLQRNAVYFVKEKDYNRIDNDLKNINEAINGSDERFKDCFYYNVYIIDGIFLFFNQANLKGEDDEK